MKSTFIHTDGCYTVSYEVKHSKSATQFTKTNEKSI